MKEIISNIAVLAIISQWLVVPSIERGFFETLGWLALSLIAIMYWILFTKTGNKLLRTIKNVIE